MRGMHSVGAPAPRRRSRRGMPGHLHVVPRRTDDGWTLPADPPARDRVLLDREATALTRVLSAVR